jgi:hypothetical protein
MNLGILFVILVLHYVADFVIQTDWQARNKSSRWDALLGHTFTYSMIFFGFAVGYIMVITPLGSQIIDARMLWLPIITFFCHTTTDYITSREVKKQFDKQNYHNGFAIIGFDQLLHYTQLILTYLWLSQS